VTGVVAVRISILRAFHFRSFCSFVLLCSLIYTYQAHELTSYTFFLHWGCQARIQVLPTEYKVSTQDLLQGAKDAPIVAATVWARLSRNHKLSGNLSAVD
jgi:hypothetical protein